jgi:hypothetical protein
MKTFDNLQKSTIKILGVFFLYELKMASDQLTFTPFEVCIRHVLAGE